MAERTKDKSKGYGKLLDAWVPPKDAGTPVGCIATSFTFSASFFEEECLSRFLALETDPSEDGPLYLIEREEKLSQVTSTCAIVDQHFCKGARSLRWDLLPARLPSGILHAKISLLVWSNMTRVLIASANLTEDGYRRNLEVFGTFDYHAGGTCPTRLLQEVVAFLRSCANFSQLESGMASSPLQRLHVLLDRVQQTPPDWGCSDEESFRRGFAAYPILVGADRPSAIESLMRIWPANTPPTDAHVLSPFFDPPAALNKPARELWQRLRKRGEARVSFYLVTEELPDGLVLARAPESLMKAQPTGRSGVETQIRRINLEEARSVHAKAISLDDDRWTLHMIGSSNFTSAGLGLNATGNLEANVAYLVDGNKQPKLTAAFELAFPTSATIDPELLKWLGPSDSEDEVPVDAVCLPIAFATAIFTVDAEGHATVVLTLASRPPTGWTIVTENDDTIVLDETSWVKLGEPKTVAIDWMPARPPSGFWVTWQNVGQRAWWPINVESSKSLPPPDELKSLSLEVLIEILSSARPLHRVLNDYLKREAAKAKLPLPVNLVDPHKRVDTSQFLLQRTRRISWALSALRERLERPVATEEGLNWRLYGPVGVRALSEALLREGQSPEEKVFLLSELSLELKRVNPSSLPGCLTVSEIRDAIQQMISELHLAVKPNIEGRAANLTAYVREVFEAVLP
jgi:hypothetical protein